MEDEELHLEPILKEMRNLDSEALITIVRNTEEDNALRLQAAWEVLEERGLSESILSGLTAEDEKKQLNLHDLSHPENEEEVSDDSFAEKIEFLVGSEIRTGDRDILGVLKPSDAREMPVPEKKLSEEERIALLKRQRAQLTMSAASFLVLVAIHIFQQPSAFRFLLEGGLLLHSLIRLFLAFSTYQSLRSDQ